MDEFEKYRAQAESIFSSITFRKGRFVTRELMVQSVGLMKQIIEDAGGAMLKPRLAWTLPNIDPRYRVSPQPMEAAVHDSILRDDGTHGIYHTTLKEATREFFGRRYDAIEMIPGRTVNPEGVSGEIKLTPNSRVYYLKPAKLRAFLREHSERTTRRVLKVDYNF